MVIKINDNYFFYFIREDIFLILNQIKIKKYAHK